MLVVHVHVQVRPEYVGDFLAATVVNAQASLAEPGVLRFDVLQDEADRAHVVLVEAYHDADAAAAHKQTPHPRHGRPLPGPRAPDQPRPAGRRNAARRARPATPA